MCMLGKLFCAYASSVCGISRRHRWKRSSYGWNVYVSSFRIVCRSWTQHCVIHCTKFPASKHRHQNSSSQTETAGQFQEFCVLFGSWNWHCEMWRYQWFIFRDDITALCKFFANVAVDHSNVSSVGIQYSKPAAQQQRNSVVGKILLKMETKSDRPRKWPLKRWHVHLLYKTVCPVRMLRARMNGDRIKG